MLSLCRRHLGVGSDGCRPYGLAVEQCAEMSETRDCRDGDDGYDAVMLSVST